MGKFSEEEVVVKNEFFDRHGAAFQNIGKHDWKGDKGKDSYWVFKYKDKIEQMSKPYLESKKELAEWVSLKDPATGDPVRSNDGGGYRPDASKMNEYEKRLNEQANIEVPLEIKKRFFDPKGKPFKDDINPDEWAFLKPYIANWSEFEAEFEKDD